MTEIKLDPESVAAVASAAILDHIGEEAKNDIMKQAVQGLLTPDKSTYGYGAGKTPLQMAFDAAISSAAYKVVQDKVAEDPRVVAAIEEMLGPLVLGVMTEGSKNYNDELADVVGSAIGRWLAEKARS